MFITKLELHNNIQHLREHIDSQCSAKELLEIFIQMLRNFGYTQDEINSALRTRKQVKDLKVEIGKLKSYIDELEYDIRTKYRKQTS